MTAFAAVVAVVSLVIAFRLLNVWPTAAEVLVVTRRAAAVITDGLVDDDAKEREVRAASKRLLRQFVVITARAAVVLAVPAAALLGFDALGLAPVEEVTAFLLRWEVILAGTVAVLTTGALWR